MSVIETRIDQERGCGWRKEGGLYLVSGTLSRGCGKLPIPLTVCPCCHGGIKPTRGFTWVGKELIVNTPCSALVKEFNCMSCVPFDGSVERFGLLWVGGGFYKSANDFITESATQGISRRISAVPKDFKVGESWILLAHRQAIKTELTEEEIVAMIEAQPETEELLRGAKANYKMIPGIFQAFQPTAIEYVVKGNETAEEIDALIKRGITPVKIERKGKFRTMDEAIAADDLPPLEDPRPLKRDEKGHLKS